MKVILIRHGITAGNKVKQYIGRTDQPLCEEGIKAIKEIAQSADFTEKTDNLNVSKIFVSPMKRCRQTAEILYPNAEQIVAEDLREMDFGIFEEKNYQDLEDSIEYKKWLKTHCEGPVPEGENKEDFTKRCCDAFVKCLKDYDGENAYFLVHGGTIMAVMDVFCKSDKQYYQWYVENGHGYIVEWDGKEIKEIEQV